MDFNSFAGDSLRCFSIHDAALPPLPHHTHQNTTAPASVAVALRSLLQRLRQIGDQILNFFDAYRQAHQTVIDTQLPAHFGRH